ncbi:MAG: FAD-binding oxidoreductase [Actinomycetota bacterium]|nr:FAD-binding oxidoreductase [Actinomycetota bacterium]
MIHDAQGFWLLQEPQVEPNTVLEGEESADVVVIGGGFAGMWTAWLIHEAEPEARVALVEAGLCGHGPSGRNGGFANSMWFSLQSMRERFGDQGALGVARAAERAIGEIGEWCSAEEVDASYRNGGYLQVSTANAYDETWAETVAACQALGEPGAVEVLRADEVRERCASPIFRAAAFFPASATVNPARLSLGLRRRLIETGVEVYELSKVRALEARPGGVVARTDSGAVRAEQAVLATGGAQEAVGPLRGRLTLTSSHMVITEPVPDVLEEIGWTGGECITDARHMLHYFRTTDDGRIAFGWGGGRVVYGARLCGHAEVDADVVAEVATHLVRFFPQLEGRPIAHAWGGPIDVSPTHTPIAGTLDGRVHYAFGFTGNGVGPSRMIGHVLASLALDLRDEHSRLAIVEPQQVRVPPEPFRYAGGTVIRDALLRKERAEELDREPDPLSATLSVIPERVGVQIGR